MHEAGPWEERQTGPALCCAHHLHCLRTLTRGAQIFSLSFLFFNSFLLPMPSLERGIYPAASGSGLKLSSENLKVYVYAAAITHLAGLQLATLPWEKGILLDY